MFKSRDFVAKTDNTKIGIVIEPTAIGRKVLSSFGGGQSCSKINLHSAHPIIPDAVPSPPSPPRILLIPPARSIMLPLSLFFRFSFYTFFSPLTWAESIHRRGQRANRSRCNFVRIDVELGATCMEKKLRRREREKEKKNYVEKRSRWRERDWDFSRITILREGKEIWENERVD